MDLAWGHARAVDLIEQGSAWLQSEVPQGRWHTMLAMRVCGLAVLAHHPQASAVGARLLATAPDEAFWAGTITDMDRRRLVRRNVPSETEIEQLFPVYGPAILEHVRRFSDPHIRLVLDAKPDEAWARASTDLAKEECLATCALVGDFQRVTNLLPELVHERWEGPLVVSCVESYRRGDSTMSGGILDQLLALRRGDCWMWIHLASGYLGRGPWGGYPFPDY